VNIAEVATITFTHIMNADTENMTAQVVAIVSTPIENLRNLNAVISQSLVAYDEQLKNMTSTKKGMN
jgi:hypothetical protein